MARRTHNLTPESAARHYVEQTWSQTAIAARYGVSQMTVSRYLRAAGIESDRRPPAAARRPTGGRRGRPPRPLPAGLAARLGRLRAEGLGVRACARALDRPLTSTWKWLRKLEGTR